MKILVICKQGVIICTLMLILNYNKTQPSNSNVHFSESPAHVKSLTYIISFNSCKDPRQPLTNSHILGAGFKPGHIHQRI